VETKNNCEITPLMKAAVQGHLEVVAYLLEAGANPRAKAASGETALHFATQEDHKDIVDLLLDRWRNGVKEI
jgi:ankyrin repeat protein